MINHLMCAPLSANIDRNYDHFFLPQSPVTKTKILELFSVENQLLNSYNGNLNF